MFQIDVCNKIELFVLLSWSKYHKHWILLENETQHICLYVNRSFAWKFPGNSNNYEVYLYIWTAKDLIICYKVKKIIPYNPYKQNVSIE